MSIHLSLHFKPPWECHWISIFVWSISMGRRSYRPWFVKQPGCWIRATEVPQLQLPNFLALRKNVQMYRCGCPMGFCYKSIPFGMRSIPIFHNKMCFNIFQQQKWFCIKNHQPDLISSIWTLSQADVRREGPQCHDGICGDRDVVTRWCKWKPQDALWERWSVGFSEISI